MRGMSRRMALAGAAAMAGAPARAAEALAWGIALPSIEGGTLDLAAYRGRVLVVANTASFCGFVDQFRGLEALNRRHAAEGLAVIGMPSNDFDQEMDSNAKVKQFCEATYDVDFPMAGLSHVRGAQANPFYAWARAARGWEPDWNFNKVLVGRDGRICGLFGAKDAPEGLPVRRAIEGALSAAA